MVGTAEYHVGRKSLSQVKNVVDVTARGTNDTRTGRQRGEYRGKEPVPMKQR